MEAKKKIVQCSLIISTFFLFAFYSASSLWAADYYVAQSSAGNSNGSICGNAKSLSWFNSNASAGDTAILCDGSFTTQIAPSKSGTSGSPITYIADNQYSAVISTRSYGADLTNKSYIVIDGLYFNDCGSRWLQMVNSDYCIIQNNKFYDGNAWNGVRLADGADYNKILNNIFEDAPASGNANGTSPADFIGFTGSSDSSYNVIEGNVFGNCYHDIIFLDHGDHNVFRGNSFQNTYHTGLNLNDDGPNLVENNYFYDQGLNAGDSPPPVFPNMINNPAIQMNGTYNIIRKNILDNNGSGIMVVTYGGANTEAYYTRAYNNTVNKGIVPLYGEAVDTYYLIGNIFKNNIFTNSYKSNFPGDNYPEPYEIKYRDNNGADNRFYNNNAWGTSGDYRYRSTTQSTFAAISSAFGKEFPSGSINLSVDPKYMDAANRDFSLQPGSPMIDAGTWLTTITSGTASGVSSFVVDDSRYFYDGWGIPEETGDIIKTENGKVTTIISIDYETNTIKVSPAINTVNGEGLALSYSGSAPDIGAHEYHFVIAKPLSKDDAFALSSPTGFCIITSQN